MARLKTALFQALGLIDVPVENPNRCEGCIGEFMPNKLYRASDYGQCGQCGECQRVWDFDHLAALKAQGKSVLAEDGHTVINRPIRDSHNHFNVYWVEANRREYSLDRALNFWMIKGFKDFYRAPLRTYRSAMSYSPRHREGRLIYMGLSTAFLITLFLALIGAVFLFDWISPKLSDALADSVLSIWLCTGIATLLLAHLKWGFGEFVNTIPPLETPSRSDRYP